MTNFFPNREPAGDPLLDRLRSATVGLYDVAGEIGRGGMAVVYVATDMRLRRRVAIKVMEPRLNFTPGMADRFLQEATIAAQLQHHNIIVVHEVRRDDELLFFVMRLVEGGSLDEICRRLAQHGRRLPIDQAQWILWQSARALAYAHSEGIVHRDVKPANILISTKGEVVVTDFGIAKAVEARGLTQSGMAIGTPTYMAPEQFVGTDPLTGSADQYALGVAAFEMLTGAPPFSGDLYRMIAAHGSTPAPDIRERRPDCPDSLADAVMRMLAKTPAERFPSLDAALGALGQGLSIDGSSTRTDLAAIATELQQARANSVAAWGALTPVTPPWSSGGSRRSTTPSVPAAISVSPPSAQIVAGKQVPLRAVVTSDSGNTISDAVVVWSSTNPAVATVAPDGSVTGVARGTASIRAEVVVREGSTSVVRAVSDVTVTNREVTRVEIRGGDCMIKIGEKCGLVALAYADDGSVVDDANVLWTSSPATVVQVDDRGNALALEPGEAEVTARVGSVLASVRIDVAPAQAPLGSGAPLGSEEGSEEGSDPSFRDPISQPRLPKPVDQPSPAPQPGSPPAGADPKWKAKRIRVTSSDPKIVLRGSTAGPSGVDANSTAEGTASASKPAAAAATAPSSAPGNAAGNAPANAVANAPTPHTTDKLPTQPTASSATPAADPKPQGKSVAEAPWSTDRRDAPTKRPNLFVAGSIVVLLVTVLAVWRPWSTSPASDPAAPGNGVEVAGAGEGAPANGAGNGTAATAGNGPGAGATNNGTGGSATGASGTGNPPAGASASNGGSAGTNTQLRPAPSPATAPATATANPAKPSGVAASNSPPANQIGGAAGVAAGSASIPPAGAVAVSSDKPVSSISAPPAPKPDSTPAPDPTPPRRSEPSAPSDNDARRLAREFALRLDRGEFRTGTLAAFFSGTTSSHHASISGDPRIAGREGDATLVDVDVQLERTLGSGAVQRRMSTVRLVLRAKAGAAAIESATAGAVKNSR